MKGGRVGSGGQRLHGERRLNFPRCDEKFAFVRAFARVGGARGVFISK